MKKWKIIKIVTIIILIIFMIYLICDAVACISLEYPRPTLGIDTHNWIELFIIDVVFIFITFGIPIIIDIILLIISIIKLKKCRNK